MRRAALPLLALALALAAPSVRASEPAPRVTIELTFTQGPAASCTDEDGFKRDVIEFVECDLFRSSAPLRLQVSVTRRRGEFAGTIELRDESGRLLWDNTAIHDPNDCAGVVRAMAFSLARQLDRWPQAWVCPPAPAEPPPAPAKVPAAEPLPCPESRYSVWSPEPLLRGPEPDPPKPPERWPVAVRLGVAVGPELVAKGWGSFGFSVAAGARYRAVSVGVEAHGDPPLGSVPNQNLGAVSFARVSGALLLCAHYGWFAGCGVGDAGRFLFPNHVRALPASAFYGAVGVRGGFEFPVLPPRLFVGAAVDLRAPIHPASYTYHGASVFESAGPGVGLSLGLLVELPP